jgi:hypothetical protein
MDSLTKEQLIAREVDYMNINASLVWEERKLKKKLEAFEKMTGIDGEDIIAHADPDDDSKHTYKTCDEYEEEINELEEQFTEETVKVVDLMAELKKENDTLKEKNRVLNLVVQQTLEENHKLNSLVGDECNGLNET